jgi:hypothetical protein
MLTILTVANSVAILIIFVLLGYIADQHLQGSTPVETAESWTPIPIELDSPQAIEFLPAQGESLDGKVDGSKTSEYPTTRPRLILVLSTICRGCRVIAEELALAEPHNPKVAYLAQLGLHVVVIAHDTRSLEAWPEFAFMELPVHIDHGGTWTRSQLGLAASPAVVFLHDGKPSAAYAIQSLADIPFAKALAEERSEPTSQT